MMKFIKERTTMRRHRGAHISTIPIKNENDIWSIITDEWVLRSENSITCELSTIVEACRIVEILNRIGIQDDLFIITNHKAERSILNNLHERGFHRVINQLGEQTLSELSGMKFYIVPNYSLVSNDNYYTYWAGSRKATYLSIEEGIVSISIDPTQLLEIHVRK